MASTAARVEPHQGLMRWLARHGIDHEVHQHRLSYTAKETARAEGVEPRSFAKVVGVEADDGRRALLVLDAVDRVSLPKAAAVLGTTHVRLLREPELEALAPDCEAGALPAVGSLFGLPLYADEAIRTDAEISFNAGSHRVAVRVDRRAWEAAEEPVYVDLAADARELSGSPRW
jgi:Ala-tRNA(Pro) deacylase